MSVPVSSFPVRISRQRLVLVAFVCLLLVAAGLRFYDLPGDSLSYDEAVAANNSSGDLSDVVDNTRHSNSSPILYPLTLWLVQKVDASAFSIRVLPAVASVLTVAVMLFLLPSLGVGRLAAFLAALLATLSVAAIEHAQDAREYSIDALLAVLMIAGLLLYLRDGRKALLCLSLFLAPLLQYGLVLFGVALMAAAIILPPPPPPTLAAPERDSRLNRLSNWLQQRIALAWPAGCFMAGCVISYLVTLRHQWQEGGFGSDGYLSAYYYQGKLGVQSIFEFSFEGIWSLFTYHLPEVVAIAALVVGALLLVATLLRKFQGGFPVGAIAVLFALCIAISVAAVLLRIYPMGAIRQVIYLGPIIFLAVGVAFHWTAGFMVAFTRRVRLAPALAVMAAGAITLAGVGAIWQDSPYRTHNNNNTNAILAVLDERVQEEDMVFAVHWAAPATEFHRGKEASSDNYYYGTRWCTLSAGPGLSPCLREMVDLVALFPNVPDRLFLVYDGISLLEELELLGEQVSVERVPAGDGGLGIALIKNIKDSRELTAHPAYNELASGEPALRSTFDVYLNEGRLIYVKDPCASADTEAMFFLALYPVDVNDLPYHRQRHGFDNLDFRFDNRGVMFDGRCAATVALPQYAIATIGTGQYVPVEDGFHHFWEGEFPVGE